MASTADFCDSFYNSCNIMHEVYRGWMLGMGEKPKAGYTIHKETNYNVVSSVGHRNSYSQPGMAETIISSSLTPHAAQLMPLGGSIYPVVDCCGYTGLARCHL